MIVFPRDLVVFDRADLFVPGHSNGHRPIIALHVARPETPIGTN